MEIKDILQQLSITAVLEHYHLKPNKNKMVCCPFHDDKNPSMQVYADTNTVFCFSGNCKMNGKKIDAIQFIQDKENISKHEAIKRAVALITIQININPGGITINQLNYGAIKLSMKKLITFAITWLKKVFFGAEDYLYSSAADYAGEKGILENIIVVK